MLGWLRAHHAFWWVVLGASISTILLIVVAALAADPRNSALELVKETFELTDRVGMSEALITIGSFMQNNVVYGVTIGLLFSFVSTAILFIYKIDNIRNVAIQAIAYGYFENFLVRLIQHASAKYNSYRIVLVIPSFQLVEYPNIYLDDIKSILLKLGFEWHVEKSDDKFSRNAFFVQRKGNPPIPLFIDVPTTLKTLRKILELEADMPAGKVVAHAWWRHRFDALCLEFKQSIEQVVPTSSWGNVVFVPAHDKAAFEAALRKQIEVLERELASES